MKFWSTKTAGLSSSPLRSKSYHLKKPHRHTLEYSRSKLIPYHRYEAVKDFKIQPEAWLESEKRLFAWFIVFYTYLNRDQAGIKVIIFSWRLISISKHSPEHSLANALIFSNFIFLSFSRHRKKYVGISKKTKCFLKLLSKIPIIQIRRYEMEWNFPSYLHEHR